MANLNPTFKKELNGKKITIDFRGDFTLSPYELNQIRFWINLMHSEMCILPNILPVSKRFVLDFSRWHEITYKEVLLCKFKKSHFSWS